MRLLLGDCIERMRELDAASIDAIVTDPPYGLEFMGKDWDAPWKHGFTSTGYSDGAERPERPNYGSTRNPVCRTCRKHQRGTDRCICEMPNFDERPADSNRLFQAWVEQWAVEALRVLKPGGHALIFGGTRTFHRLASGVEDAGFEVRDCIAWMYGSGFPKSLDVSKQIDKAAGAEREVVGPNANGRTTVRSSEAWARPWNGDEDAGAMLRTAPATDAARRWDGWGTALKPAFEPVVVARKPLVGTVAANVLEHGTGAINVDGCRIEFAGADDEAETKDKNRHADFGSGARENDVYGADERTRAELGNYDPPGRWPANVLLGHHPDCVELGTREVRGTGHTPSSRPASTFAANTQPEESERSWRRETVPEYDCHPDCAVRLLDEQTGELGIAGNKSLGVPTRDGATSQVPNASSAPVITYSDRGGASRFFYCAKTSRAERNAGLDGFDSQPLNWSSGDANPGSFQGDGTDRAARNNHPTVKPVAVMRWLVRLVTPPGGTVLDPFLGSGTTGIAAALEGMEFVGIERDPDYMEVARARIAFWAEHGEEALRIVSDREQGERRRAEIADAGQLDLFAST